MESFDIVFPINLPPLTYYVPEELKGLVRPGQLVKAEIKNTERVGLVIGRSSTQGVKMIKGLCSGEPIINESLLKLIEWMADYYLVHKGLVLKTMYPGDFFDVVAKLSDLKASEPTGLSKDKGRYQTLLFHIPTMEQEISLLSDLVRKKRNIIILGPERSYVERIVEKLKPVGGERISLLYGDLTKKERKDVYSRIILGLSDVVIGTRIAIFAPLRSVSTIFVLREEDGSYKNIHGMRFHGRDVAVIRGYLERARVILSSAAPSVESYYNAVKGKYKFVRFGGKIKAQRVEIIDMNRHPKVSPYISKRVVEVAKTYLRSGGRVLLLINRKGYSLIRCKDCNYIEGCSTCNVPLVYHKDRGRLLCHYCGKDFRLNELCPACGGATLETVGAGTQRIEAEIGRHLGTTPLRLEKGKNIKELKARLEGIKEGTVIVSTGVIKQFLPERFFSACIFINPDIHLQFPDFRSGERLFQGLNNMRDWVRPDGSILIQTRFSESYIFRAFRRRSIDEFYNIELSMRRSLLYPPFSRLATVMITSGEEDIKAIDGMLNSRVKELIYSSELHKSKLKGRCLWRLIFKSSPEKRLHEVIRELITTTRDRKGIKISIDIDPLCLGRC